MEWHLELLQIHLSNRQWVIIFHLHITFSLLSFFVQTLPSFLEPIWGPPGMTPNTSKWYNSCSNSKLKDMLKAHPKAQVVELVCGQKVENSPCPHGTSFHSSIKTSIFSGKQPLGIPLWPHLTDLEYFIFHSMEDLVRSNLWGNSERGKESFWKNINLEYSITSFSAWRLQRLLHLGLVGELKVGSNQLLNQTESGFSSCLERNIHKLLRVVFQEQSWFHACQSPALLLSSSSFLLSLGWFFLIRPSLIPPLSHCSDYSSSLDVHSLTLLQPAWCPV